LVHHLVFSAFPVNNDFKDFPFTAIHLNLTPGISPTACPFLPNPEIITSSFSLIYFKQPSFGTNAATFFPFFLNCTLTHFLIAELGYFDSTPIFSTTIPLACEAPMKGFLHLDPICYLLNYLSAHLWTLLLSLSFLPALNPLACP